MPIAHPVRTPRRRFPRVDEPPFTGSHWVARTGLPARIYDVPSGHWIVYKGRTYIAYQGGRGSVSGAGPVQTVWYVGGIVSTADGLTWSVVFDGADETAPLDPTVLRMPGMFFIRDDTLYCVMSRGGWSTVNPWCYLAAGEVAIWKTTDGVIWVPHQTLVSWPAAGAGENVGGTASGVSFGASVVWRAAGSGPAGDAADWLIITYSAFANVPGAPVSHTGMRQYRSLDDGETWVEIRNMLGTYPYVATMSLSTVFPVPRPGVAMDRWVMVGGDGFVNYSDNSGATWTSSSGSTRPTSGFMVPSGGLVFPEVGSSIGGPTLALSCDYGITRVGAPGPGGALNSQFNTMNFPASVAGGEEMIAATKRSTASSVTAIWHSTNGGETWTDMGDAPTTFGVPYGFARTPSGRIILYAIGGGTGATSAYCTCDDAPTGIPTPRSICPFVVEPPDNVGPPPPCPPAWGFTPVPCAQPCPTTPEGAEIAALLAPILARRRALYTPRFPEFTCARPLGAFVLGSHCLGVLPPVSVTTPPYERDGACLLTGLEVFTNAPCPPTPVPGPRI